MNEKNEEENTNKFQIINCRLEFNLLLHKIVQITKLYKNVLQQDVFFAIYV